MKQSETLEPLYFFIKAYVFASLLVSMVLITAYPEHYTYKILPPGQMTWEEADVPTVDPWFRDEQPVQVITREYYRSEGHPLQPIKGGLRNTMLGLVIFEALWIGPRQVWHNIKDNIVWLAEKLDGV